MPWQSPSQPACTAATQPQLTFMSPPLPRHAQCDAVPSAQLRTGRRHSARAGRHQRCRRQAGRPRRPQVRTCLCRFVVYCLFASAVPCCCWYRARTQSLAAWVTRPSLQSPPAFDPRASSKQGRKQAAHRLLLLLPLPCPYLPRLPPPPPPPPTHTRVHLQSQGACQGGRKAEAKRD